MKCGLRTIAVSILIGAQVQAERLVLASASYGNNIVGITDAKGDLIWSHQTAGPKRGHTGHHDIHLLKNGNILFHETWTKVLEMNLKKEIVWEYDCKTMSAADAAAEEKQAEPFESNFFDPIFALQ